MIMSDVNQKHRNTMHRAQRAAAELRHLDRGDRIIALTTVMLELEADHPHTISMVAHTLEKLTKIGDD
jgi:hypothetical protein